jgi:hypothetical protein
MILPLASANPDTSYPFPNIYPYGMASYGFGRAALIRQESAAPRSQVQDIISLSPAARRLLDQAHRLEYINNLNKE